MRRQMVVCRSGGRNELALRLGRVVLGERNIFYRSVGRGGYSPTPLPPPRGWGRGAAPWRAEGLPPLPIRGAQWVSPLPPRPPLFCGDGPLSPLAPLSHTGRGGNAPLPPCGGGAGGGGPPPVWGRGRGWGGPPPGWGRGRGWGTGVRTRRFTPLLPTHPHVRIMHYSTFTTENVGYLALQCI